MRKTNNIIAIFMALVSVAAFYGCTKDGVAGSDADPVVRFVRPVDQDMGDKLLTEVSMGATVAVIGEGLGEVDRIAFNDQTAKLNPTLVTPTSIIVTVPSTMPEDITNKMYLHTSAGKTAEYDLTVMIPSPSVQSIECEYAPVGSEVTISGNYFFLDKEGTMIVEFPGNLEAEVTNVTETEITCIVPEGADLEGPVSVTSAYGTSRSKFSWHSTEGRLTDFSRADRNGWNTWSLGRYARENGCDGEYLQFAGTSTSWVWPSDNMQFFYLNPNHAPLVSEGTVSDYSLVFEYCCMVWENTPIMIWFNGDEEVHSVDDPNAQYHWKLYEEGFEAGVWKTVSIPLTDFNTDKEETTTERKIESFDDMVNLHMMVYGASDAPGEIDIRIDNPRLVRNK